ncbi:MAG: ABC transporter substrate-binding protein [Lachnospiraceae bacterium]|nr:ABC transporter substrate-binding protein [Lachnospiraceae bacterium]
MRKGIYLLLLTIGLLAVLSGCGKESGAETDDGRDRVTIAFWSDQLTEQYGEYLRDAFPEVDFTFYVATNSADFYRFKEAKGDLPDILTIRRFALRDVEDWKDSLLDLSDTELTDTIHQSYLRSYTYQDGTVNWLPVCAEVDSIIVNKTLLEEHGISVPANYGEFVSACEALREEGIRPFISDYSADYTCMEILQGLSVPVLTSQTGREWRQQYESAQTNQLSEEVWLPVFERMEEFIGYAGITAADIEMDYDAVFDALVKGEAAMARGTGDDAVRYSDAGRELVMMPYYGETEQENWYLTYPAFQIAASAKAEESPERKQLILDIMTAMLNEQGQREISANQNMVPYNSGVTIDLSPAMSGLQSYADRNQLYIRLASADMFSISKQVVQGMIVGEYPDARSAYEAFNAALAEEKETAPAAAHIDEEYFYDFDSGSGSPAASAVMNSVREAVGTELLIGQACNVAGNIASGDYTEQELQFLTMGETLGVWSCQMAGEQIYEYLDYVLTTQGKRGSVINDSTLYVSSGFEMAVRRTDAGYELEKLTIDGKELDKDTVYSVTIVGSADRLLPEALSAAGVTDYTESDTGFKQIIVERLASGKQLAQPSNYITLS